ncbi:MAG: AMP-binding protein [Burkholderiaceae bacterium]
MHTAEHAVNTPDKPAIIMASSGRVITYRELDGRSNQFAHCLRDCGLKRLDHYSVFMENNSTYLETNCAGERSGLYFTCINSWLTAGEVAYILTNSESRVLVTSHAKLPVALEALSQVSAVTHCFVVDYEGDQASLQALKPEGAAYELQQYEEALVPYPTTAIADESLGTSMLYSSGTTGHPKGILRPLPEQPPSEPLPLHTFLLDLFQYRTGMTYLSPAPLYHAAPNAAVALVLRIGGTIILMERFDPLAYLELVERYQVTHSQLVPTMFSRMIKLPPEDRQRFDLSSLEVAIHAAAPCPVPIKEQMIQWWGPIIHEYYGATEGLGFTACNTEEWLAHKGSVGKVLLGDLHVLDQDGQPSKPGEPGEIWFKTATPFEYFNDPKRTREAQSSDGQMSTVGDIGYVDDDGFLYLTDRASFMIISGGVNVYPQEAEDLLISHVKVQDAAVFGIPNEDLGEEVKAVIQVLAPYEASDALAEELIAYCKEHLATVKCPRSIDFMDELPRLPTGKLYKRGLRDKYWQGHESKI